MDCYCLIFGLKKKKEKKINRIESNDENFWTTWKRQCNRGTWTQVYIHCIIRILSSKQSPALTLYHTLMTFDALEEKAL